MRLWTLIVAALALLLVVVDFFATTVPRISEAGRLRAEIEQTLLDDTARLRERGRPPDSEVVRHVQDGLRLQDGLEGNERKRLFSRATDVVDFLVPPAQRPIQGGLTQARETLSRVLLTLPLELHEFPSMLASDLGLRFPSATVPLTADPEQVRDQSERAVATGWTLDCLRSTKGIDVRRLVLRRAPDGLLEVELRVAAGIDDLVLFYEHFLADSHRIAPRDLVEASFQRLEPETWDPDLAKFTSPPVELHLRCRLWRPRNQTVETVQERGS